MPDHRSNSPEIYEAPRLVVIGAVRDFTFGSDPHDNSDHSTTKTDGSKH